jgi:hypothetical protein
LAAIETFGFRIEGIWGFGFMEIEVILFLSQNGRSRFLPIYLILAWANGMSGIA